RRPEAGGGARHPVVASARGWPLQGDPLRARAGEAGRGRRYAVRAHGWTRGLQVRGEGARRSGRGSARRQPDDGARHRLADSASGQRADHGRDRQEARPVDRARDLDDRSAREYLRGVDSARARRSGPRWTHPSRASADAAWRRRRLHVGLGLPPNVNFKMSIAFVFPGQGSQQIGMMDGFSDHPVVRATFTEASEALGDDLWQLVHQGPAEALNLTRNTQPVMLTAGIAVWRAWQAAGGATPSYLAGHSLGEYTALVAAGALAFRDAVPLVRFRAEAMQQAVAAGVGAMAAVIGADETTIADACREAARGEVVEPVNFNAPNQIVIAGNKSAVERAMTAAKARGAKRALLLPVSAPFHSSLLAPAAERLAQRLAQVDVAPPVIP